MIRGLSSSSSNALAAAESKADYFATETHYRSLVNRIDAALRAGDSFVLVIGDPPPASHLLAQALHKSTQFRYAVIDIVCRAGLTSEDLSRARAIVTTLPVSGTPIGVSQTSEPSQPLLVFADVDQLSDRQIREIFEDAQHSNQTGTAALLVAPTGFLNRLEEPSLLFLKKRLSAQFGFQEVGQNEGMDFLRHQLAARHTRSGSRGSPAGVFRGLTASGVLLVIGVGAFLFLQHYHLLSDLSEPSGQAVDSKSEVAAPRPTSDTPATPRPAAQSAPTVPRVPPIAAAPQPAQVPKAGPARGAAAPAEDRAIPHAPSPTASGPGRPALAPEMTSPTGALPPATDTRGPQAPSFATEPTATQSAHLAESTPPVASLALLPQQATPKAGSRDSSPPPVQSPASQRLSPTEIVALVTRGDGFLSAADIASARLFYERAADAGNGSAALRLGATFDPGFLSRAGIRGITGDPAQAGSWYRRARELGEAAAADRLKDLDQQRAAEPNSPSR